jgi:hypothetical protein
VTRSFASEALARSGLLNVVPSAPVLVEMVIPDMFGAQVDLQAAGSGGRSFMAFPAKPDEGIFLCPAWTCGAVASRAVRSAWNPCTTGD